MFARSLTFALTRSHARTLTRSLTRSHTHTLTHSHANPPTAVLLLFEEATGEGAPQELTVDEDTAIMARTGEAALRAVGAVCAAVDAVMRGEATNAFCAVRPPGHHAERTKACGFCFFNNVAVAAEYARRAHGITRVAVVDFDVHHGNGALVGEWTRRVGEWTWWKESGLD